MEEPARGRERLLEAGDCEVTGLGTPARHATYDHIERSHEIKREEIPEKLGIFYKALPESVLGISGKAAEKCIARNLYQILGSRHIWN